MKPYEFTGKISNIYQTQNITQTFAKRVFTVERADGERAETLAFELTKSSAKDRTGDIQRFKVGDTVTVKFYISSRESPTRPGSWFWNCRAVEIVPASGESAHVAASAEENETSPEMPF